MESEVAFANADFIFFAVIIVMILKMLIGDE